MGQAGLPTPLEGMRAVIAALLASGLPKAQVDMMVKETPARLVGLKAERNAASPEGNGSTARLRHVAPRMP